MLKLKLKNLNKGNDFEKKSIQILNDKDLQFLKGGACPKLKSCDNNSDPCPVLETCNSNCTPELTIAQ
jgi:hypothetical protein